ncbi:MAG: hypothetical protein EXS01_07355 [Phycisphaerales bacterium]|nr:hypothetical protein [Phycisphaerales bacterium]
MTDPIQPPTFSPSVASVAVPPVIVKLKKKSRGFLNPAKVRAFAFYLITLCILVSVLASILAIWDFAQQDSLWRTIATCVVVAFGCGLFAVINMSFGGTEE